MLNLDGATIYTSPAALERLQQLGTIVNASGADLRVLDDPPCKADILEAIARGVRDAMLVLGNRPGMTDEHLLDAIRRTGRCFILVN